MANEPPTVIIGGGKSLTQQQIDACRGRTRMVVINNAYQLAPDADHLHSADLTWWRQHPQAVYFAGTKTITRPQYANSYWDKIADRLVAPYGVEILQATGDRLYDPTPDCVRTGSGCGGYQMLHREVQRGAKRIFLLGFDMRPGHWHAPHPHSQMLESDFAIWRERFAELEPMLAVLGIEVINCTPGSELKCFPKADLARALDASA